MPDFKLVSDFKPTGDQPEAIRKLTEGLRAGNAQQTLLGATGTGKTYVMAAHRRGAQPPDAGHGAQQDARRPALQRVQGVLPAQRGGVLRQLLRLLSAGSLSAAHRHLHREGLADQRRDRPAAAGGHVVAAQPPRCADRRLGVVHLRPGRPRRVRQSDGQAAARDAGAPRAGVARAGGHLLRAQRHGSAPRQVPRARRHARSAARLRRPVLPRRVLRRRCGSHHRDRSADRRGAAAAGRDRDLPGQALHHAAGQADRGARSSSTKRWRSSSSSSASRASCWRRSGWSSARATTWR